MTGNRDRKLLPYKVMVTLLYGYVPGVERVTADNLVIDTSKLANHLGLPNHRLREYLADLSRLGVVGELTLGHGWARLQVEPPVGYEVAPRTVNAG